MQENFQKSARTPIAKCREVCDNVGIMNMKAKGQDLWHETRE